MKWTKFFFASVLVSLALFHAAIAKDNPLTIDTSQPENVCSEANRAAEMALLDSFPSSDQPLPVISCDLVPFCPATQDCRELNGACGPDVQPCDLTNLAVSKCKYTANCSLVFDCGSMTVWYKNCPCQGCSQHTKELYCQ